MGKLQENIDENGITAGILQHLGVDPTVAQIAGLGSYFIPGVGSALAVGDAVNSFRQGNIGEGLINSLFIIPGASTLKAGVKALKFAGKTAKWVPKTTKAANAVERKLADPKFVKKLNGVNKWAPRTGIGLAFGHGLHEGLTEE